MRKFQSRLNGDLRRKTFIENEDVIKKILKHLGLWEMKLKPRPRTIAPSVDVFPAYDEQPGPSADNYIKNQDYPAEAYF